MPAACSRPAPPPAIALGSATPWGTAPTPGLDQGIRAGRGLAVVVARLKGHDRDAAGRQTAGPPQGQDLGVIATGGLGGADTHYPALVFDNDAPARRIWICVAL